MYQSPKPQDMNRTAFDYDNYRQVSLVRYRNGDGYDLIEYDEGSKHSIADIPGQLGFDTLTFDEQNVAIDKMVRLYSEKAGDGMAARSKLSADEVRSCLRKQVYISR